MNRPVLMVVGRPLLEHNLARWQPILVHPRLQIPEFVLLFPGRSLVALAILLARPGHQGIGGRCVARISTNRS